MAPSSGRLHISPMIAFIFCNLVGSLYFKLAIGQMGTCHEDSQFASFMDRISFAQQCGALLAFAGWILSISATLVGQWRQWEVGNSTRFQSGVMWIGIWGVCYKPDVPDPNDEDDGSPCLSFDSEHSFIPTEIFLAQDLMSLCAVMETLALGFFYFAYWNIIKTESAKNISLTFFTIGGLLSLTSGVVILIPVTWNVHSVLNNQNINFPESFGMPSHPKKQFIGVAIYLGFASAIFQITSGLLFLSNKSLLRHKKTYPLGSNEKCSENCPHCGSSMNIAALGRKHEKLFSESEIKFKIPMGPIPDQRVAQTDTVTSRFTGEAAYF